MERRHFSFVSSLRQSRLRRRGILKAAWKAPQASSLYCVAGLLGEPGERTPPVAIRIRRPLGFTPDPSQRAQFQGEISGHNVRGWRLPARRRSTANGGRIMSSRTTESDLPIPLRRAFLRGRGEQKSYNTLVAELEDALAREAVLLKEKHELSDRQVMLAQEFEHRLVNGLQLIVSLLSLQSRAAKTPEAAEQLTIASQRVSALGRVHRRLHLLDHQVRVEFKEYLQNLCEDLSGLLIRDGSGHVIGVEGTRVEIPTTMAIPLGFIVNEL